MLNFDEFQTEEIFGRINIALTKAHVIIEELITAYLDAYNVDEPEGQLCIMAGFDRANVKAQIVESFINEAREALRPYSDAADETDYKVRSGNAAMKMIKVGEDKSDE